MEIFGLTMQDFFFQIFLPFLFFFLLIYALLRKTKILGEGTQTNRLNSLISLTLSALSIFSLYSLGLSASLPIMGAITVVAVFAALFLTGTVSYGLKKEKEYISGDAFKTKEEKSFGANLKNCENLWKKYEKTNDQNLLRPMVVKFDELEQQAEKLGKDLYRYGWYTEFKKLGIEVKKQ